MISLEFGHLYSDELPGNEQLIGAQKAREVLLDQSTKGHGCVTCVMIDSYHPAHSTLILTDYLDFLEGNGMLPDYVVMEGDLRKLSYQVLYSIPKSKRKDISRYMEKKDNFPCSLLTATFYLFRLGMIHPPKGIEIQIKRGDFKAFFGQSIINVLPERYRGVEQQVLDLIGLTPWHDRIKDISYVWF